jgi:dihydrofolate reductase
MATVVIDMSVSLDGFVAGPNDGHEFPLGERGGERIVDWFQAGGEPVRGDPRFRPAGADRPIVEEMFATSGAVVSGRRTYEIAGGWGGTFPINAIPVIVVTHEPPADPPVGESRMTFVTDGVDSAIRQAREAAGDGVVGVSGASISQQALQLGLVDEIRLHVAPILLGDGVQLFEHLGDAIELDLLDVIDGPGATHVRYAVRRSG